MNKFLLASISMVASSVAFLSAGTSYAEKAAAPQAQTGEADQNNQPKYLGKTGIVLAPGPVRLDKDGKPVHNVTRLAPSARHKQDLQMKSDLEALKAGKAPVTNQQRALARMVPHDRELLLNRVNEALAAYKG